MSEPNEEPKIIVDEDWKSQVEREKAEAAAKAKQTESAAAGTETEPAAAEQKPAAPASEPAAPSSAAASEAAAPGTPEMPPSGAAKGPAADSGEAGMEPPEASFASIVTLFFTQAMMMLGQFPDPSGGQPTVDKPIAKHYIDTMEVLQEKTKGNLTADEERMLGEALHAARMAFVSA